jgi:hypothetical protein
MATDRNTIKYDFDVQVYNNGTSVETGCIDVLFINQGANTVYVRNIPLTQGQQFPINGNVGEMIESTINITFDPSGTDNRCIVVRRYYL